MYSNTMCLTMFWFDNESLRYFYCLKLLVEEGGAYKKLIVDIGILLGIL
jgi:hypothetical protein